MTPRDLPDEILREAVPDDDLVLAYVTRGALARYVEGVAAKNPEFREELVACIDGLEDAGETVSATARAWREPSAAVVPIHSAAKRRGIVRWMPIAAAAAFLLAAGWYHHSEMVEAERVQAEKDQELADTKARLAKVEAELKAQEEAVALAQNELASARSDADRAVAQAKLMEAQQRQSAAMSAARSGNAGAKPKSSAKAACNCQPGDALCSCL